MRMMSPAESFPALETLRQLKEIVDAKGAFELGQRAEREAQEPGLAIEISGDLAAMTVGMNASSPPHVAAKASAPADSRAISKVISPSCRPAYSSATIWNGPVTVPKSGIATCQSRISLAKNTPRQRVAGLVLEQPAARQRGALQAGAAEQFAPAPGRFRIGDVDGLGVEGQPPGAQSGDGDETRRHRRS
jgi:hypothetical protein